MVLKCFGTERTHPKHTCKMLVEIWISKKWNFFLKDFIKEISLKISFKNANKLCIKFFSLFEIRLLYKKLGNMFWMWNFDSETFKDDILNLDIKFRRFSKKLEMRFLQLICLLAQNIPLFLPKSSDMVKPTLEL